MQPAPHPLPLVSSAMAAVNWSSVRVCAASVELEGETTAEVGGASASVPAASEADVVDVVASASLVVAAEVGVVSVSVVTSSSLVVSGSAIECELVVFLSQPNLPG